uniref:Uncharacterized protein n=1 Tax=Octopus bimaculoides TaxID=37653 RepID=A0A0L8HYB0_OCTBM
MYVCMHVYTQDNCVCMNACNNSTHNYENLKFWNAIKTKYFLILQRMFTEF